MRVARSKPSREVVDVDLPKINTSKEQYHVRSLALSYARIHSFNVLNLQKRRARKSSAGPSLPPARPGIEIWWVNIVLYLICPKSCFLTYGVERAGEKEEREGEGDGVAGDESRGATWKGREGSK